MDIVARTENLVSFLPKPLSERILKISKEAYEIQEVNELKKKAKANERLELLRESFWNEYEKAIVQDRVISSGNIYEGICNRYIWHSVIKDDFKLMYIITPTAKYESRIKVILKEKAVPVLNQILDAPMFDCKGDMNINLAALKVRVIKQLEDRIKGNPVQRIENKEFKLSASVSSDNMEDLKKRMEELDAQLSKGAKREEYKKFRADERKAILEEEL